jgi:DNA mismatch repair protein MutL
MRNKIFQLPESIANQIKAGEVVLRPASVVKELMENAIDAGAKHITVNFRNGGIDFIQVIDDGCGMTPQDAVKAFDRHATSKISSVEDLYRLRTFGFRGEALASIAAVAEVELKTATTDCECATSVTIHGGELISTESTVHPIGSQFVVKNLFYNTPARRKFLKSDKNEGDHIIREFQKVALCHPDVELTLYQNDVLKYNLLPGNLRQRIVQTMGNAMRRILMDLNVETSIIKIHGFVCSPKKAKKENSDQYMFVNGRYFRSPYLHKAITKAYENIINAMLSPGYFIYLEIDPERIDVNVHPQKTEVKFEDENAIWQILNAAVRESLAKMGGIGIMDLDIEDPIDIPVFDPNNNYAEPLDFLNPNFDPFADENHTTNSKNEPNKSYYKTPSKQRIANWDKLYENFESTPNEPIFTDNNSDNNLWSQIKFEEPEIVTQQELALEQTTDDIQFLNIGSGKCVVTLPEGIAIIDLRRAHQHLIYNRTIDSICSNKATIQRQILTEPIQVTHNQYEALKEINSELIDAGFDIEFGDDHNVNVLGVPAELDPNDICNLLNDMLDNAELLDKIPVLARHELIAHTISKNAVSRDAAYTNAECRFIISEILSLKERFYTTDGLQIMWIISNTEINKQFKKR